MLVIACGEFGRTPRVTHAPKNFSNQIGLGRDHWPQAFSALIAGGNLRMGQVVGQTNSKGRVPAARSGHAAGSAGNRLPPSGDRSGNVVRGFFGTADSDPSRWQAHSAIGFEQFIAPCARSSISRTRVQTRAHPAPWQRWDDPSAPALGVQPRSGGSPAWCRCRA